MPTTPSRCTFDQLQIALGDHGASRTERRTLAAIGMCEAPLNVGGVSYSDNTAVGDLNLQTNVWGPSVSFFQVRTKKAEKGKGTLRDIDWLTSPDRAIDAALTIARGPGGYGNWSTYNSGIYKAYLQDEFPPPPGVYQVISGDSLSGIAQRLSKKLGKTFDWPALAYINGLTRPWVIRIGQQLLLPWTDYTVKSGDRLVDLLPRFTHGVTQDEVEAFNHLTSVIRTGQLLRFPRETYLEYLEAGL